MLYRLGRTQVELKDWTAAIATLDRLLTDFPENSYRREARYLRAEAALQTGDGAAALSGFSALLSEAPATTDPKGWDATIRVKQIQSWIAMKKWKEALESARAMKTELSDGDALLPDVDFASGQALVGIGTPRRGSRRFSTCYRRRWERRPGRPCSFDARGSLLPSGQVPRSTPRFSQGRYPLRRTAMAGGRAPGSWKSL